MELTKDRGGAEHVGEYLNWEIWCSRNVEEPANIP